MAQPTLFFEDFSVGDVLEIGTYEMTESEIIDFGRRFDPQTFHIDPQAARETPFGGLIASGWHTCAAWARLWIDSVMSHADGRGSPGMEEVRWLEPVRPGDSLAATVKILEARPSARHADRGTVMIDCAMTNQHGRVVFTARGRCLFGRRYPSQQDQETQQDQEDHQRGAAAVGPANVGSGPPGPVPHQPPQRAEPQEPAAGNGPGPVPSGAVEVRSSDGVELNLRLMGGSGPDLLICHATGFHGLAYRPLAVCLSESFRVWALDFRGHGASGPAPHGDYAWSGMGVDVAACAAAIGAAELYGFGHSMGGAALLLAERAAPGTFAAMFLYEPIVLPERYFEARGGNPLAVGARKRREVFDSRAEALDRYSSRSPLGVLRADALSAYVEGAFVDLPDGRVRLACAAETEARTFEASGGLSLQEAAGIDVQATVAAGTVGGDPNPAAFAPGLADTLPRGQFQSFSNLSHFGPLEAPRVVATKAIEALRAS